MTATLAPSTTKIDTLFLSEQDMIAAGVKKMSACIDAMEDVFRCLGKGDFRMGGQNGASHGAMVTFPDDPEHEGMPVNGPDRRFMAMPAYLGGRFNATGMKWYGSNIENKHSGLPRSIHLFVLNDTVTGAPLAMLSANLLSAYRTGAVPGVGARIYADPDSEVAGIVGPGVMGRTTLASFAAACPKLHTVKIKGRSERGIQEFKDWVGREVPQITTIEVVDTLEHAVRGSDLVTITTSAEDGAENYPMLEPEWLKPGAFVALPASTNMPGDYLASGKVQLIVDYRGLYEAWLEEYAPNAFDAVGIIGNKFLEMQRDGKLAPGAVLDIADVLIAQDEGKVVGKRSPEDITIMSVGGMPVEDVAWAYECYHNAVANGIGTSLNLWEEPELA